MNLLHLFADFLFIAIALVAFPSFSDILQAGTHTDRAPLHIEIQPPTPSVAGTPLGTPLASPLPAVAPRPPHKRKSVSFSINSMSEVMYSAKVVDKRPPTPWVSRRSMPPSDDGEDEIELPRTPVRRHSDEVVDPMGVKKAWLRGG